MGGAEESRVCNAYSDYLQAVISTLIKQEHSFIDFSDPASPESDPDDSRNPNEAH